MKTDEVFSLPPSQKAMKDKPGSKDGVVFLLRFAYTAASRLDFFFCGDILTPKGDHLMAESKLRTLSIDFAVQILNLVKFLKSQHETIVSNQIGRAGTSIGANIHEAQYAHGKLDFIAKLQIASKKPTKQVTGWNCC